MKSVIHGTVVIPELEELAAQHKPKELWSKEEEAVVIAYHGRVKPKDLAAYLNKEFGTNRAAQAIINRAYVLRQRGELE